MTVPLTIISFTQALCIAVLTALVQLYIVFHDFDKIAAFGREENEFPGKAGSAGIIISIQFQSWSESGAKENP